MTICAMCIWSVVWKGTDWSVVWKGTNTRMDTWKCLAPDAQPEAGTDFVTGEPIPKRTPDCSEINPRGECIHYGPKSM